MQNQTIIVVTHDEDFMARTDEIIEVKDGEERLWGIELMLNLWRGDFKRVASMAKVVSCFLKIFMLFWDQNQNRKTTMKTKGLGLLIAIIFFSMQVQAQYQIIAHRGASYRAPENTVASVALAWELDADAVEVDIHLSKDGHIMVNHDKDTKRTAGEQRVIKDTEAKELRKLDVGSFKDPQYKGEKMPFLEEIIPTVPEGKKLFIEVKCGVEVLPVLKDLIRKGGKENQMVIISFNKDVMTEGKKLMPEIPFYWLLGNFEEYSLDEAVKIAKENNLDGLDVHYNLVTPEFMQRMEKEGLAVYTYTVNDADIAEQLVNLDVDGITTDRPQWLKEQL